jgi:serine protease Do
MDEMPPIDPQLPQNVDPVQTYNDQPRRNPAARIISKVWGNVHAWRALTLVLVISFGLQMSYVQPLRNFYEQTDPTNNGYVEPRDLGAIIESVGKSVVTVYCDYEANIGSQGTGWAFEFEDATESSRTTLVTNHHVIEDCIDGGEITLEDLNGEVFKAELDIFDANNDLAILTTSQKIPGLPLATYPPANGYWVMAYGTADGYSGSVATGNIINIDEYGDLMITANLSGGNSGGPLIDNEGRVFGVNTWTYNNEAENTQYNISVSLDSFCDALFDCDGETWFDWDY